MKTKIFSLPKLGKEKQIFGFVLCVIFSIIAFLCVIFALAKENEGKVKADEIIIRNFNPQANYLPQDALSADFLLKDKKLSLDKDRKGNYKKTKTFVSSEIVPKIEFNAIAALWRENLPEGSQVKLEIRVLDNRNNWSSWNEVKRSEDGKGEKQEGGETFSELLFFKKGLKIQYKFILSSSNSKETPEVTQIKFVFIDSTSGPRIVKKTLPGFILQLFKVNFTKAEDSRPRIILREEWGADESLMHWSPEYYQVKTAIIHHTAGKDGGHDPAIVLRGIYYYHAVTLGWGDIGYNYLVDKYGNIYQGRKGGDGVEGGHAWGFNKGSIGIALIGTYEEKDVSKKAIKSLSRLLAYKLYDFGLSARDFNFLSGKKIKNISGHKDVNQTLCPGKKLYGELNQIRNLAFKEQKNLGPFVFQGEVITSFREQTIFLEPGQTKKLKIKIKNKGNITWHNFTFDSLRLGTSNPRDRKSLFRSSKWFNENRAAVMNEFNVEPGEVATFDLLITAPKTFGVFEEYFAAVVDSRSWIKGTEFKIKISVTGGAMGGPETAPYIMTGAGSGGSGHIRIFNKFGQAQSQPNKLFPFSEGFRGAANVASGDIDNDGVSEIIIGSGKGRPPEVKYFEQSGQQLPGSFYAFHPKNYDGVDVAASDINGDGVDEVIISQEARQQAWIKVVEYNHGRNDILAEFVAYDRFEVGARVSSGDVDKDGLDEVITIAGPGGTSHIRIFDIENGKVKVKKLDFFAFHPANRKGFDIASGDVDGDGQDEIIVSQRFDEESWIKVYRFNLQKEILAEFVAFGQGILSGANISSLDLDEDGKDEIIVGPSSSYRPQVKIFNGRGDFLGTLFDAYDKGFKGGIDVAGARFNK